MRCSFAWKEIFMEFLLSNLNDLEYLGKKNHEFIDLLVHKCKLDEFCNV